MDQSAEPPDPSLELPSLLETHGSVGILHFALPVENTGERAADLPVVRGLAPGDQCQDLMVILSGTAFVPEVDRVSVSEGDRGLDGAGPDPVRIRLTVRQLHGPDQVVSAIEADGGLRPGKDLDPGSRQGLPAELEPVAQDPTDEGGIGRMAHLGMIQHQCRERIPESEGESCTRSAEGVFDGLLLRPRSYLNKQVQVAGGSALSSGYRPEEKRTLYRQRTEHKLQLPLQRLRQGCFGSKQVNEDGAKHVFPGESPDVRATRDLPEDHSRVPRRLQSHVGLGRGHAAGPGEFPAGESLLGEAGKHPQYRDSNGVAQHTLELVLKFHVRYTAYMFDCQNTRGTRACGSADRPRIGPKGRRRPSFALTAGPTPFTAPRGG